MDGLAFGMGGIPMPLPIPVGTIVTTNSFWPHSRETNDEPENTANLNKRNKESEDEVFSFTPHRRQCTPSSSAFLCDSLVVDNASRYGSTYSSSTTALDRCIAQCCPPAAAAGVLHGSVIPRLFWKAKGLARRVVSTYATSPLVLIILPLLVGCFVGGFLGFWYGRQQQRQRQRHRHRRRECGAQHENKSWLGSFSGSMLALLFSCICTLRIWIMRQKLWFSSSSTSETTTSSSRNTQNHETDPTVSANFTPCLRNTSKTKPTTKNTGSDGNEPSTAMRMTPTHQERHDASNEPRNMYESGVAPELRPKHIAVIMDGNRRYGRAKFGLATKGHWEGSKKLCQFCDWCLDEGIPMLTVYAFSTENWSRDEAEVQALMEIILRNCEEIKEQALRRGMCVRVWSTEKDRIPDDVKAALQNLVDSTEPLSNSTRPNLYLNICLSYGSRGDIVNTCQSLANDVKRGTLQPRDISQDLFGSRLVGGRQGRKTHPCYDDDDDDHAFVNPDVLIRTSGEYRLSNFLLWELAYAELFFWQHTWPEVKKEDLVNLIRQFAWGRDRRFGR